MLSRLQIREESIVWKSFQIIRTFSIVCIGYILFRSDSLKTALVIFNRIVTSFYYDGWTSGLFSDKLDKFYWVCMFIGIGILFLIDLIERNNSFICWLNRQKLPVRWGILYIFMLSVIFVIIFSNVREAGVGNFIYYKF